ncbi:YrhK family protein [Virgibacillus xinjiangensis]|uniref:YrhK family protein n=1 Tax=Virgibacillus xinjiangensis TaxID=393090 RepID=A0ABV7CQT4_9BACI
MGLIPKIRTKEKSDRYDLEIDQGPFKIYFTEKYATLQLIGDIMVGVSFVTGSILNFWQATDLYGNIAYLLGSLSLTIRPILKIIRKTWIYGMKKDDADSTTDG